jgi:hypothetical protein
MSCGSCRASMPDIHTAAVRGYHSRLAGTEHDVGGSYQPCSGRRQPQKQLAGNTACLLVSVLPRTFRSAILWRHGTVCGLVPGCIWRVVAARSPASLPLWWRPPVVGIAARAWWLPVVGVVCWLHCGIVCRLHGCCLLPAGELLGLHRAAPACSGTWRVLVVRCCMGRATGTCRG